MVTTIQISKDLQEALKKRKIFARDTYEDIIWDLLEDHMELSEETKKHIEIAKKQIENGETFTHEEVKKKLGLD